MKDHVTSLEMSKKLMESGVKGKHNFLWWRFTREPKGEWRFYYKRWGDNAPVIRDTEMIPAYLLSELLEMVEYTIDIQFNKSRACITMFDKNSDGISTVTTMSNKSAINTIAEAVLWQKEIARGT